MKFVFFFLLSSLTLALALAFPDHDAANALPTTQLDANAVSNAGSSSTDSMAEAAQVREPRFLLKKWFRPQTVVVQHHVVVHHQQPYYGRRRGW